jgi:hypothetical protein
MPTIVAAGEDQGKGLVENGGLVLPYGVRGEGETYNEDENILGILSLHLR